MMEPSIFGKKEKKRKRDKVSRAGNRELRKNRESVDRARGTYLTDRLFRAKLLIGFR